MKLFIQLYYMPHFIEEQLGLYHPPEWAIMGYFRKCCTGRKLTGGSDADRLKRLTQTLGVLMLNISHLREWYNL